MFVQINMTDLPNRSQDLLLKKSPFAKIPSFFKTYSRFFGSLMTTPGGKDGTEIWNVSKPNWRSHFTNQEKSLWRAWRNKMPFPARGRVFGGRLKVKVSPCLSDWALEKCWSMEYPARETCLIRVFCAELTKWYVGTRRTYLNGMPFRLIFGPPNRKYNVKQNNVPKRAIVVVCIISKCT